MTPTDIYSELTGYLISAWIVGFMFGILISVFVAGATSALYK